MQIFIMHIGNPGKIDLDYTVTKTRSIDEILEKLSENAPERSFFDSDAFREQFPSGNFNCWGVPIKAKPTFEKTRLGDLVLFVPEIGEEGGLEYIGVVKAICPVQAYEASRILWPDTPNERLFPWLYFFYTEAGFLPWYDFLREVDIQLNWNPRGWYKKLADKRFKKWRGPAGYLNHLRSDLEFSYLNDIDETVTEKLNEIYETEPSTLEPDLIALQMTAIGDENW